MSEELWSGEDGCPWDLLGKHVPEVANEFLLARWLTMVLCNHSLPLPSVRSAFEQACCWSWQHFVHLLRGLLQ